jgi:hypothetical protein
VVGIEADAGAESKRRKGMRLCLLGQDIRDRRKKGRQKREED